MRPFSYTHLDVYKRQVSYETTNANASPAIYFDSYGHAVVPLLGGIAIRDLNAEETKTLDVYKRQGKTCVACAEPVADDCADRARAVIVDDCRVLDLSLIHI